jgi:hypothetical protein
MTGLTCVFALVISSVAPFAAAAAAEPIRATAESNRMAEVEFVTALKRVDPFNEVVLDVVFTEPGPGGPERRVPAFWAGGRVWKVRYASGVAGGHRFRTESSDDRDAGLHGITGVVEVTPYKGDNPLFTRGPLRVSDDKRYLRHADGTPFFWLGDTWWMGLTSRLSFPGEFDTLLADRTKKGFNVVQIVAGLYPDMPAFDERGANEAGFPWEQEYAAIRPAYFDEADRRIVRLVEAGVVPCVVGAWGYHLPWLGPEKMKQHQRYVYARWGALPIVWCVAGELNLPFYLEKGFPYGGEAQKRGWEDVIRYCRTVNAFDRPITAHPTGIAPMSARLVLKDAEKLLDFDMLQTPHGQMEALPPTVETVRGSVAARPVMPSVNGEPSYEMLHDKTPAEIARMVFWVCWANGVKGYTYGANGIWQLNGRDKPYGNSPWGGSYGKISWQDAMNLGGSAQVALGKQFLAQFAWHEFEPHPQWAAWAPRPTVDVPLGDWIWFPDGEPATDSAVGKVYLRRSFEIPAGNAAARAALRITADDRCAVFLDGEPVGEHAGWNVLREFEVPAGKLTPGRHVLAVEAENAKADVPKNPAGMVCGLAVELAGGGRVEVRSDATWRAAREPAEGWTTPAFDDSAWPAAKVASPLGGPPWGEVKPGGGADAYVVPYAMGIPGKVRIVYVPKPGAIVISQLEPGVRYRASAFDPATGELTKLLLPAPDASGTLTCETPSGTTHDWVLVLDAR